MTMKKILILFFAMAMLQIVANGQAKKKPVAKIKAPTKCGFFMDGKMANKVTAEQMIAWCDQEKLYVMCDNGKKYLLKSFEISVIQKEPYAMKDFGIGEGGMPIMARREIKNIKEGDSLFLKNLLGLDDNMLEVKLPVLVVGVYNQK